MSTSEPWETTVLDALALAAALRVSPLSEREIVDRWLQARADRLQETPETNRLTG